MLILCKKGEHIRIDEYVHLFYGKGKGVEGNKVKGSWENRCVKRFSNVHCSCVFYKTLVVHQTYKVVIKTFDLFE